MLINNCRDAKAFATPHGSQIRPLMDQTNSSIERCSLAEETLPVGATVGTHYHRTTEEIYYVLSGRGMMSVGEEKREVGAGDAIYIPVNSDHTITNVGNAPMKILLVCGPAYSPQDHWVREPAAS